MTHDLFESPIRQGKVRNGIFWYQYRNGVININGEKFIFYPIKEAVQLWRKKNPKK